MSNLINVDKEQNKIVYGMCTTTGRGGGIALGISQQRNRLQSQISQEVPARSYWTENSFDSSENVRLGRRSQGDLGSVEYDRSVCRRII